MDKRVLDPEVQEFIRSNARIDPGKLALRHRDIAGIATGQVLDQIRSYKLALRKLPAWSETQGIYWPPPLSMEQCSSMETAQYKQRFVPGGVVYDLTGGAGVDSYFFAEKAQKVVYNELDPELASIANHNFAVLGRKNIEVVNADAVKRLSQIENADLIFLDPSRRTRKGKIFLLEDCEPSIPVLWEELRSRSGSVLIKLSPMLDIASVFRQLGTSIHITALAVANEMKELLVLWNSGTASPRIQSVNIGPDGIQEFSFEPEQENQAVSTFDDPREYIYEPYVSVLKAGAFKIVGNRYGLSKLALHTHLYTSNDLQEEFPGRIFKLKGVFPVSRAPLLKSAHVAVRNFPLNAEALRKKLRYGQGGVDYIYGCTLGSGKRVLLHLERSN